MPWLEKRTESWLGERGPQKRRQPGALPQLYSVDDVARMFRVGRRTVYKWLATDAPGEGVVPPAGWLRLPGGHIRIYEWAVRQLMDECKIEEGF